MNSASINDYYCTYANWRSYFDKNMYLTGMDMYASKMHEQINKGDLSAFTEHYEKLIDRLCKNMTVQMAIKSININFLLLKLYESDMHDGMEYVLKRHYANYKSGSQKDSVKAKYAHLLANILQSQNNGGIKTLKYYLQEHKLSENILELGYTTLVKDKTHFENWPALEYLTGEQWQKYINRMQEDMTGTYIKLIVWGKKDIYDNLFSLMSIGALQKVLHHSERSLYPLEDKEKLKSIVNVYLERAVILWEIKSLSKEKDNQENQAGADINNGINVINGNKGKNTFKV